MVNRIFMAWPIITDEMKNEASRVMTEEKLVMGESVFKFEEEFANFIGTDHAVSCSSGTNALSFILNFADLKGEVITTPQSFIATSNSILSANMTPVFSDINPISGNIDPAAISKHITEKTSAIMPVHLHGFPVEYDPIEEIADNNDLLIIEDAAQAHGAEYKGKKVGSLGYAGAFSFYSTKNMTAGGDGGMITTNDEKLANKIKKARDTGRAVGSKYLHDTMGYTSRLNTVSAAIARIQLRHLPNWNERRREIAEKYSNNLKNINDIFIPKYNSNSIPVYHLYPILVDKRDDFVKYMKENKIECGKNYPKAIPDQPYYVENNLNRGSWDKAREWASKVVCLPIHNDLSDEDVSRVIDMTVDYFK